LRYAWELEYARSAPFAPWPLTRAFARPVAAWLRRWDRRASERVNFFIADSKFIAEKVRTYYGRDAAVIYPPVDTRTFYPEVVPGTKEYFLMVGRLLYYKRFDLGIRAFNELRLPLKVVGQGPEAAKLKTLATSPYIEFIPNASDADLRLLYSNARALVFPQVEDFGQVAAEALACGTPVVAFNGGGGAETVEHRTTGLLFDEQTPQAIARTVRDLESLKLNRQAIARRGARFSEEEFLKQFRSLLGSIGFPVRS
ncbi:MAG: glycosyltransferase, partial [Patescibacteria group bacterium]